MSKPSSRITTSVFTIFLILVMSLATPTPAQELSGGDDRIEIAVQNRGFEDGMPGEPIRDWFASALAGSKSVISTENPKLGKHCASMQLDPQANSKRFAVLSQAIDATPYQGKRVRFRAAVRTETADEPFRAQLWFRVDRAGRVIGAFDNMADRPIKRDTWQYYDIVGDVEPDAKTIMVGMLVAGQGKAFLDDVSFTEVSKNVATTAKALNLPPMAADRERPRRPATTRPFATRGPVPKRIPLDEIGPGLFRVRGANDIYKNARFANGKDVANEVTFLLPLPLSYRDQVPLSWELSAIPANSMKSVAVYQDGEHNYVAKVILDKAKVKGAVELSFTSTVLVGPSVFDDVPARAPMPAEWPEEAEPWLASTWCVTSDDKRIAAMGEEIRDEAADDVLAIIRGVEDRAKETYRSVEGHVKKLTAVEALDARGSCTSCANLVAAMLRSSNVPARVLAGYPSWSGPLQTHYIVEAYVPDYGWYPIESTMCRSPWENMYQVNVAVIPTKYESQTLADFRSNVAGGVPYLSLTESPGNHGQYTRRGTIVRERSCDHECQQIRQYAGGQQQWGETLQWARDRWRKWVDSKPSSTNGELRFGIAADDIKARSLPELMNELEE